MLFSLHSNDRPNIQRSSQCKHKTGKQNRRCHPLKLSIFAIIKIREAQFGKEKHGKNQINGWKYDLVNHFLDLLRRGRPGALHSPGNITASRRERRYTEHAGQHTNSEERKQKLSASFHTVSTAFPQLI